MIILVVKIMFVSYYVLLYINILYVLLYINANALRLKKLVYNSQTFY